MVRLARHPIGRLIVAVAIEISVAGCSSDTAAPLDAGGHGGVGAASGFGGATGSAGAAGKGELGGSGAGGVTMGSGGSGDVGAAGSVGGAGTTGGGGSGGVGGPGGAGGASGQVGTGGARGGAGGVTGHGGSGGSSGGGGKAGGAGSGGGGGAAGGAGGGGAAGTSGGFAPCPTTGAACKILPLGDSITYGVNDEGNAGYRGPLFATALAAGQKITFTGSLSDGPTTVSGQPFPTQNEGHSGWGISEVTPYSNGNAGIATVIPAPAFSTASGGIPNIILLHIGTNDQGSFPATQMTSDLQGLLNKLVTNAPNALIVVAQIIPLGYGTNSVIKAYNQSIPGLVQSLAAAGKHVQVVDMYTGFNASTMLGSDSIHPNSTGYQFMAARWYAVISSLLPK